MPNLVQTAKDLESFGAQGITIHPRPDERHIRYQDAHDLKEVVKTELNIEGNPIPTLSEFVSLLREWPEAQIFVEIKSDSVDYFGLEDTVDKVAEEIDPIKGRCVVISFHDGCLAYARKVHHLRVGWVLPAWDRSVKARACWVTGWRALNAL